VFVLASFFSRGLRFMILSALVWKFGAVIKEYLEKYFEIFTIAFTILLVGGFLLVKSLL
jgi:membrane protein DedA with SNARE-associated domain